MSAGNVLFGVLVGVATGALLGILFAPEKGSKTRKRILRKNKDFAEDLKENVDELNDAINKKIESLNQDARSTVSKGKGKYDDLKKDLKLAVSDLK